MDVRGRTRSSPRPAPRRRGPELVTHPRRVSDANFAALSKSRAGYPPTSTETSNGWTGPANPRRPPARPSPRPPATGHFDFAREFKKVHGVTPFGHQRSGKGSPGTAVLRNLIGPERPDPLREVQHAHRHGCRREQKTDARWVATTMEAPGDPDVRLRLTRNFARHQLALPRPHTLALLSRRMRGRVFVVPYGGFAGRSRIPTKNSHEDWYVWHFTEIENIASILAAGELLSDDRVGAHSSITNRDIRDRRQRRLLRNAPYAENPAVSDHVPWYFNSKSPTHFTKQGFRDDIVFLGMNVGDLIASGVPWSASDGNAAVGTTEFTHDASGLGDFIDFDLMYGKWWNNISTDLDRQTRRAAEILVYQRVSLSLVSVVACRLPSTTNAIGSMFAGYTYPHMQLLTLPALFY